jgi:hypothetical protein
VKLLYQTAFTRYLPLALIIVVIAISCRAFGEDVLPNKPAVRKSSLSPFWIAVGIDAVATFADAKATNDSLRHGCLEVHDSLFGTHPSPGRVYGTMFGFMAAEQTVSYFLRKHDHHKLWLVPMFTNSGLHLEGAIHSSTC